MGPVLHRTPRGSLRFVLGHPAALSERRVPADFSEWFPEGDPLVRDVLFDVAALLGVDADEGVSLPTAALRGLVEAAVAEGLLRVERLTDGWPTFRVSEPVEEKQHDEKKEKKTFVAIQLVDDADPSRPVPFKRYRIELPDGSTREGLLDQYGRALVDGIDEGECKVSFPDFDAKAWKKG